MHKCIFKHLNSAGCKIADIVDMIMRCYEYYMMRRLEVCSVNSAYPGHAMLYVCILYAYIFFFLVPRIGFVL